MGCPSHDLDSWAACLTILARLGLLCPPGDVMFTASDIGWVVGHSYMVYAPLLAGCTTIIYEGKPVRTPDPSAFWRVLAEHKVRVGV